MARVKTLSAYKMEKCIYNREGNVYDKKVITKQLITSILLMYMDECWRVLAEGERIEISKVGSILLKNIENGIYGFRTITIQQATDGYFKEKRLYTRKFRN